MECMNFICPKRVQNIQIEEVEPNVSFIILKPNYVERFLTLVQAPLFVNKYTEINSAPKTLIGVKVHNKYYGEGVVVSDNGEYCKIQYNETAIQCKKERLLELIKT